VFVPIAKIGSWYEYSKSELTFKNVIYLTKNYFAYSFTLKKKIAARFKYNQLEVIST